MAAKILAVCSLIAGLLGASALVAANIPAAKNLVLAITICVFMCPLIAMVLGLAAFIMHMMDISERSKLGLWMAGAGLVVGALDAATLIYWLVLLHRLSSVEG